jgi:predicted DNA-binding helix-hairpin-helix protein
MNIQKSPNTLEKLELLGNSTAFEPAGDQPASETRSTRKREIPPCISNLSTSIGFKPIMKTMMTTICERNCYYCPFRAGRSKTQHVTFKPDEMASTFDQLQSAGIADGLFLSSGRVIHNLLTI